jgi:hypothetical protein
MKNFDVIHYENRSEACDAHEYLKRLIEPEDEISIGITGSRLTIVASEQDIKAMKLFLAKVDL